MFVDDLVLSVVFKHVSDIFSSFVDLSSLCMCCCEFLDASEVWWGYLLKAADKMKDGVGPLLAIEIQ